MKTTHLQWICVGTLVTVLSLFAPSQAAAAAGNLDPRFGRGGRARIDFGAADDYSFAVKIQPDGKVVVAGQSGTYPVFHAALARFQPNGRLDQSFGIGGKTTAALDPGGDGLLAIALQPDGKIIAAGSVVHNNFAVAFVVSRFNADGSLDQTFGNSGSVETTFGDPDAAGNDLVLQSDGKIIVVGFSGAGSYSDLNDFALARYNSDGSLDQTYGQDGKVTTHFPGVDNTGSNAICAALQSDGKLIAAGTYINQSTPNAFALARYATNGDLDSTFGNGGLVTTRIGPGDAFALSVVLQGDGKIVLGGYSDTSQGDDFTLARYNDDGTLDQTFGTEGTLTTNFSATTDDIAYSVAVQRDGKIVAGGRSGEYPAFDFALARYTNTGQLDSSFGAGGMVLTDFGNEDFGYAMTTQRDGKIILAGAVINLSNFTYDMGIARYLWR